MDKKIIIFNALQTSLSGGIGRYCYELSKSIYNLQQITIKIVIREEDEILFSFAKKQDLIVVKGILDSMRRNYYEQFVLPKRIYKDYPTAVVHYPDSIAPLFSKNQVIITVHDVSFKAMRNVFTFKTRIWKNIITKLSMKKACKIIADTEFTKNEILKYYLNIKRTKIDVVHCGFNDFSNKPIDENKINSDILKLKEKEYILTVSTISPRKNIDGLIRAFDIIKNKVSCNIVIAGKNGWLYESVYKLVKELNLENKVTFTGGINDEELSFLYKNAKVFVYPSFYEGFGLPPLEAMSFGIPCIVSNRTSIPEVVGDFAIQVNPYEISEMAEAINNVIIDNKLYDKLAKNGFNRIKKFSWLKCAENTLKIYYEHSR